MRTRPLCRGLSRSRKADAGAGADADADADADANADADADADDNAPLASHQMLYLTGRKGWLGNRPFAFMEAMAQQVCL
jgi:hypothetical protein